MRKLCFLFAVALLAGGVSQAQDKIAPAAPGVTYGKSIDAQGAVALSDLEKQIGESTSYNGKVEGKVVEVCKKKGCFMKLERSNGEAVMVKFTDYGFFMPQNIVGKTVVVEGKANVTETSVERLRHYAEDAGKSKEEIEKIKTPKKDIVIVADGVVVVK